MYHQTVKIKNICWSLFYFVILESTLLVIVPDNGSSIARIKSELDETLAEEYSHEITIGIILVPII